MILQEALPEQQEFSNTPKEHLKMSGLMALLRVW